MPITHTWLDYIESDLCRLTLVLVPGRDPELHLTIISHLWGIN